MLITSSDIYGHATKDHEIFVKSTFYAFPQPEAGIVAERNLEKHREARKLLSHGFSSRALKDQESILHEKVNLLVEQVSRFGDNGLLTLNMKDVSFFIFICVKLIQLVVPLA